MFSMKFFRQNECLKMELNLDQEIKNRQAKDYREEEVESVCDFNDSQIDNWDHFDSRNFQKDELE